MLGGAAPSGRPRNYLLCTVPRSGSWLLADLLEQTGVAGRPDEYFRPDLRRQRSWEWGIPVTAPYGRFIRSALENSSTDNGVFGVKAHWHQFDWVTGQLRALPGGRSGESDSALVDRWLQRPRYVRLRREDTARQAISYYRAAYSDLWFRLAGEEHGAAETRFIRPVAMPESPRWEQVRYCENVLLDYDRRWDEYFARSRISPLQIRYEDLAQAHDQTLRRVLAFIGVPLASCTPLPAARLEKQADELTERWTAQYRACRDQVEPQPLNLDAIRKVTPPLAFRGQGASGDPPDRPVT